MKKTLRKIMSLSFFIAPTSLRSVKKPNNKPPKIDITPNEMFIVVNHIQSL